jgi:signal transduction histidine kinase
VARIDQLARNPGDPALLVTMLADERAEVVAARAALDHSRKRMLLLGGLLTLVALVAAGAGLWRLVWANALEGEVAARTAQLQAVDRSRRLFFAKASHELRTPVTAMRSLAEVTLSAGAIRASRWAMWWRRRSSFPTASMKCSVWPAPRKASRCWCWPCDLRDIVAGAVGAAGPFARLVMLPCSMNARRRHLRSGPMDAGWGRLCWRLSTMG